MKRILVLIGLSLVFNMNTFSQCVPDTSINQVGVYPDSATGLAAGTVNIPYIQVIQLKVPADTVIEILPGFPITITIDSVHLAGFSGLPPGLSYSCSAPNCTFLGGANGCADISGTPTVAGVFPLTAVTVTYAAGLSQTDTINYYSITIGAASGLNEFSSTNFEVKQNSPNPFNETSLITYNIPQNGEVEFRLFNMLGKQVYHSIENKNAGVNTIQVDANKFPSGIYMYSVKFDKQVVSKRLVISKK